jgi:hypothetical protein
MTTDVKTIHIFVDVTKTDHRKVEFETDHATGREIKEKAKVPVDDDLARREHGQLIKVENDETITLKDGEHFAVFPAGTIS